MEWSKSAEEIENLVRAMNPWPVAQCDFRGAPLKIWRAQMEAGAGQAGTILDVDKYGLSIATGKGAVKTTEVQAAGKPRMNAGDWARGARLAVGDLMQ